MVHVAVFGANGPTGLRATKALVLRGHSVIALVRNPASLDPLKSELLSSTHGLSESDLESRLIVRKAEVTKKETLEGSLSLPNTSTPVDVVISCVGGPTKAGFFGLPSAEPTTIYSDSSRNILGEIRRVNSKDHVVRFIAISANSKDPNTPAFYRKILKPRLMNLYVDMWKMEDYVVQEHQKNPDFEYTFVRAVFIHDKWKSAKTGWVTRTVSDVTTGATLLKGDKWWLHYDDVAQFLVEDLVEGKKFKNDKVVPIEAPKRK